MPRSSGSSSWGLGVTGSDVGPTMGLVTSASGTPSPASSIFITKNASPFSPTFIANGRGSEEPFRWSVTCVRSSTYLALIGPQHTHLSESHMERRRGELRRPPALDGLGTVGMRDFLVDVHFALYDNHIDRTIQRRWINVWRDGVVHRGHKLAHILHRFHPRATAQAKLSEAWGTEHGPAASTCPAHHVRSPCGVAADKSGACWAWANAGQTLGARGARGARGREESLVYRRQSPYS